MDFCRASVVPSELIPSVDTPHDSPRCSVGRDGDFLACLDCTLYRGDRSGVRGCGDHTDNPIVAETVTFFFLQSHVFPPEKVNNYNFLLCLLLSVSFGCLRALGKPLRSARAVPQV